MGVSSFAIFFMKLKLEWHSIIFTSIGGIVGIIFGELSSSSNKQIFQNIPVMYIKVLRLKFFYFGSVILTKRKICVKITGIVNMID